MGFLKIAGATLNQTPLDWDNNTLNIITAIQEARKQNVNILCLPELCITGYGCEDLFLSKWVSQKGVAQLMLLKEYCENITVSLGLPIYYQNKLYNCACLIKDKQILGFTAKQHLAGEGIHYEPRWFSPWPAGLQTKLEWEGTEYDLGDKTYEVEGLKIGFEICEDAWVSDELRPAARHYKNNVNLILNPSASHFAFSKSTRRYQLIINSSHKYNCTYVYSNLLGNEAGRIIYDGEILIAKKGKLLQQNNRFSFKNINLICVEIDFEKDSTNSDTIFPNFHEKEHEFWEASTLALYDYLRKSKNKGFILSLSGGADSSTCAVLVYEMVKRGIRELGVEEFLAKAALAPENPQNLYNLSEYKLIKSIVSKILICAYQGSNNSGTATFRSAQKLAESLGAVFYHWSIENEVNSYTHKIENAIGRKLAWETDDITLQNIQARSRSPIIWMLANIYHSLLITTSNRSEGDVGYATMDGDMSGSIAPIAGVDKYFIQQWLQWAEKHLEHSGLYDVNNLIPTAELRPTERSQTDETDLMPYKILAAIEREAIKNHKSPVEVFQILSLQNLEDDQLLKKHIQMFFKLWARNQWKRERVAPSFHLDDFNVDPRSWCRFPILNGNFEQELKELDKSL